MKYYLAIDIGASSGRGVVGYLEGEFLKTKEIYRFKNGIKDDNGHLVWDIDALERNVRKTIEEAKKQYDIESLSIDTWGVDYVLMKGDEVIGPVFSYRDPRTKEYIDEVHSIIPFEELYKHAGSQFLIFNTIYQLYYDLKKGRLAKADKFLMIPEYLLYKLTGVIKKEFTNATTTGLINAETLDFDKEIIHRLGLPEELFTNLSYTKEEVGEYEGIKVVLVPTHDTASAVEGILMKSNEPYISSGTWSLLGVKTDKPLTDSKSMKANYSNEGGVGYNRYQKNIMGMWVANNLKDELCPDISFESIVKKASKSKCLETVDINKEIFLAPNSMKEAFDHELGHELENKYDYFMCAYRSLALSYKKAIEELEENTNAKYNSIYIVGGGAKNDLLNKLTEEYTNKKIIALPIEATSIGNLINQME